MSCLSSSMNEDSCLVTQERALVRWLNVELRKSSLVPVPQVRDLAQDLQDGTLLCALLGTVG